MNIDENSRLGAVLFYAEYTNRQNAGKSADMFRRFAGIMYGDYDYACMINKSLLPL